MTIIFLMFRHVHCLSFYECKVCGGSYFGLIYMFCHLFLIVDIFYTFVTVTPLLLHPVLLCETVSRVAASEPIVLNHVATIRSSQDR